MNDPLSVQVVRELASAYATGDVAAIDALLSDDVVFHVPGRHPLSGEYRGKQEVFGYLAQVAAVNDAEDGGFVVDAVMGEGESAVALVTGTIACAGLRFVRPTVHVFVVRDGRVTDFKEASLGQHAEDEFWNSCLGAGSTS